MGKLHDYFNSSDLNSERVVCKICKKQLSSSRIYNLKIHLKNCHNIETLENRTKGGKKVIKRRIAINKFEVIRSYIGLVTENGFAYDLLNSRNLKNLLKPICSAMSTEENMFALNADNAKLMVVQIVEKLRNVINSELCNNLFSLKIDSATRLGRNIFAVSIQYCKDGNIISRVIGMSELKGVGRSKFKNLAAEVNKILSKFDLSLQQVVSVTSDNGANMLKTTSLLSKCIGNCNNYLDNEDYLMLLEEIENDRDFSIGEIMVCRCAAYTTQLVVIDVIKETELQSLILRTRNLVKFLRKSTNDFRSLFEIRMLKVPQIDCLTRWGSTFRMMSDVKAAKSIIENAEITDHEEFEINEKFWDDVNDFLLLFAPINEILLKFQEESLNYGDFYAHWLRCKLLIKGIVENSEENLFVTNVGNIILEAIELRSKNLLENNFLKACLFFDPRFHHTLEPPEKEQAIDFLKNLWDKFISIRKEYVHITENDNETRDTNEHDILTEFLKPQVSEKYRETNVYRKIENLKLPFLKSTNCVLKYWVERSFTDPELYILSNIIFGVPPTQVSVERGFSSLRLILTDSRNRLSHENLENILLAKLNSPLLDECISELLNTSHFASP